MVQPYYESLELVDWKMFLWRHFELMLIAGFDVGLHGLEQLHDLK